VVYLGRGETIDRGFVVFRGDRIEEVGPSSAFAGRPGMEIIDLDGKLLLPGLVDCHVHLVSYSEILTGLDLSDTYSLEEGLELIKSRLAGLAPGQRLGGRGWDKQHWRLEGFPDRTMLDAISPDNPVVLNSRDGHSAWVNTLVVEKYGLDKLVGRVEGGEIEVDADGRPTGILKENAVSLVAHQPGEEELARRAGTIGAGCRKLASLGLTGVHSVVDADDTRVLDIAGGRGDLTLNLVRMREIRSLADLEPLEPAPGTPFIKIFVDGALGSQSAAMMEPYCGNPESTGIVTTSRPDLEKMVFRSMDKGFWLAVHAIGDRANKDVLDVFEEARRRYPESKAILRVEHVQVLREEDIPRFGALGAIASMQPIHLVGDMDVADRYWGDRSRNAYAFKAISGTGGTLAFGSDAPIESPDPLRGIHAAVTRRDPSRPGHPAWYPDQCLTVAEVLDCYTLHAARAGGEGNLAGAIRPGLRADFTVLDKNILVIPDLDAILNAGVAMTVARGKTIVP
jgi:predicted amidohydrolase YtcJ